MKFWSCVWWCEKLSLFISLFRFLCLSFTSNLMSLLSFIVSQTSLLFHKGQPSQHNRLTILQRMSSKFLRFHVLKGRPFCHSSPSLIQPSVFDSYQCFHKWFSSFNDVPRWKLEWFACAHWESSNVFRHKWRIKNQSTSVRFNQDQKLRPSSQFNSVFSCSRNL